MTAAHGFFEDLFLTLTGKPLAPIGTTYCILHNYDPGDHRDCVVNTCRVCRNPVTNQQIEEADAHVIDERGPDDGQFEHVECGQGVKS